MTKKIWLFISSFGIMFAFFSWFQEAGLIQSVEVLTWKKGVYALFTGFLLYYFLAKNLD